ncbi:valine--tRNA ligase [Arenimonas terrae]|uniref:Valine--tRNA ligase n=1 Tax=Arenimonas terrae TaxID=2546226 RepID=A0A5C4RS58_9GAMM|nr:valine--tRNA ligase [Arenimonas terrae]TNJ33805.1 valine--tRNA ligase [Arenimonas terrae]
MSPMEKSFEPQTFETKWYAHWENSGCFKPSGKGQPYTIMLPPPNVTGTLHMGHAFQHTLMDALVRYHRMKGYDTLWQVGTDHAGIATEMVVSRNLAIAGQGETRDSLGRDKFIEKVWAWKQESGDTITRQMRRMGASGDWSRERFTMDEGLSQAVVETFVRLHEEGLIYRGQRLVNWDPVLKTAISDLEVVSEEEDGKLWSIRYPLAGGASYEHVEHDADGNETLRETRDYLVVATTRPETMLGDTAAMVHPEDARYAALIGKSVRLPLSEREIPIIADDYVDRAFGTGVVKVTPAHDFNDYAVGQRHGLPMINILTPEAAINGNAPEKYRGLDRYAARKVVLADLEAAGLLVEEKKHKLQVPRGDRTGQVIEPYLTDQWFVRMEKLAARGLELVENGSVRFVPENWINTYRHWMGNIQDWCISRQLWWGHRIPAWYDAGGKIYVGRSEEEVRKANSLDAGTSLTRDSDVLETWFSSALWSHSTLGWPDAGDMAKYDFAKRLPTSVLVTGFDIIFFWVARMIMMTDHFTGEVPFKDVYITGLVRDKDGQKMSKSKGNVLDPIDLIDGISADALVAKRTAGLMKPTDAPKIEKATRKEFPDGIPAFGADALRFTFASLATHGRDIKFDLQRCEGYKNFCNKLWNAARFALMNCEGFTASGKPQPKTDAERWILDRLQHTLREVEAGYADYRFDLASQALYEFAWNEFCDWFLELAKPALTGDDKATADSTRHTLLYVLENLLRALHPLIPFVTEEIWHAVAPQLGIAGDSISTQPWPEADASFESAQAADDIEWLKSAVTALRSIRSQMSISPAKAVPLRLQDGDASDRERAQRYDAALKFLARLDSIEWIAGDAPASAAAVLGSLKLLIPLEGLIDLAAEKSRLDKELKRIAGEIGKCQGKLSSETFVQNAPAAVVEQERARLADWTAQQAALQAQRGKLG